MYSGSFSDTPSRCQIGPSPERSPQPAACIFIVPERDAKLQPGTKAPVIIARWFSHCVCRAILRGRPVPSRAAAFFLSLGSHAWCYLPRTAKATITKVEVLRENLIKKFVALLPLFSCWSWCSGSE